jgi:hypothetical protein
MATCQICRRDQTLWATLTGPAVCAACMDKHGHLHPCIDCGTTLMLSCVADHSGKSQQLYGFALCEACKSTSD